MFSIIAVKLNIIWMEISIETSINKMYFKFIHSLALVSSAQPAGQPEICRRSLAVWTADGGEDLMIIGKNFMKNTVVIFQEEKDGKYIWNQEVPVEKEYFQPVRGLSQ